MLAAVVRILHISDPHAQTETMERLHNLVLAQEDCDVVALTGDCVSESCKQIPQAWNLWPQKLLLSVPGNHDLDNTFDNLGYWEHRPPWVRRFDDLIFVGLAKLSAAPIAEEISKQGCLEWEGCRAVVLLSHRRPVFNPSTDLANFLMAFVGSRPLLVLHGDYHPSGFCGAMWDDTERLGDGLVFRSNVYSAASGRRGLGHRIEWNGKIFHCTEVRGKRGA